MIIEKDYDVVVVGGGISGICAAISAARHGSRTALIQNRNVLGGNASSEIRVDICGASRNGKIPNVSETGIVMELLLANRERNPQNSFSVFDSVLWEKVNFQENLDLYLNTHMRTVTVEKEKIVKISAIEITTEKEYEFSGRMFVDTTGDATMAYLSGAEYTIGREGKDIYGEEHAPKYSDNYTMGSTILFESVDMGVATSFIKPNWAYTYTKEDIACRQIKNYDSGYWWVEVGGDDKEIIKDGEFIRDELQKVLYGVWDYVKNSGECDADNYALNWVGSVPGKRESRRVIGDYVLREYDVFEAKRFDDAVAYGGWTMDVHTIGGINAKASSENEEGTIWHPIKDIYTIPYRCLYSKNISNLYVGGRAISASHMAMGSTRVQATCGVVGQAIGTAAAMAVEKNIEPRQIGKYIKELQQKLIKDDCYIPGIKTEDDKDLCNIIPCNITASSFIDGGEPENVINGVARTIKDQSNQWISDTISDSCEWIKVKFKQQINLREVHIKFDPNLTRFITTTMSKTIREHQIPGMPRELVKMYKIKLLKNDKIVAEKNIDNNSQRFVQIEFNNTVECDTVIIMVEEIYGDDKARIFEVKMFE
ncbi:FAD-dependent oxidoreductase [Clostridium sp.]